MTLPVKADKKRPYKMYAAMASAFLTSLLLADTGLPVWGKALIGAVVAALAVYITPNPLKLSRSNGEAPPPDANAPEGDAYL